MRILVTGSNGFTGQHLKKAALAQGHEVVPCLSDLCDLSALTKEILQLDYSHVVHLAAISFVGHDDQRAFYDVNLFGTLNLLKALKTSPIQPQKVLITSSANVYGNCFASPIEETEMPGPVNHYAMSKLAMEHMARTFEGGLPLLLTRPFNSTGPGQSVDFLIPKLIQHFKKKTPSIELGNLLIEREFNDVRMVCEAYLRLLRQGTPGETYNIASGQPHTLQSVIDALQAITGHQPSIHVNPHFVRQNELMRLSGSPQKLIETIGVLPSFSLKETLEWMLATDQPA